MRLLLLTVIAVLSLAGCATNTLEFPDQFDPDQAVKNFVTVVTRIEPEAEATCRRQRKSGNCDFRIVVDERVDLPPNAFQTVDERGRPVLIFTLSMLVFARNTDELALIMAHEAAHHIQGHLEQKIASARRQAEAAVSRARQTGRGERATELAVRRAVAAGALRYSKQFELEADVLGTAIAARAGFDPLRGALFFDRLPDVRNGVWASHPPHDDRKRLIAETVAGL